MTDKTDEIYAWYDKARDEIYEKEEMNKNAALAFVLIALLLPFICWGLTMR